MNWVGRVCGGGRRPGWMGWGQHMLNSSAHTLTQIKGKRVAAHWIRPFSAILQYPGDVCWILNQLGCVGYVGCMSVVGGWAQVELQWAAIAPVGESSKRGEIPAVTLFQSSSLYERVPPKARPEHTVSTEKREKEKTWTVQQTSTAQQQHSTVTWQRQTDSTSQSPDKHGL